MIIKVSASTNPPKTIQELVEYIKDLNTTDVDYIHCDIMDGKFVENKTFDYQYVKELRKHSNMIFDTHLMIMNPEQLIEEYIDSGSEYITFHIEATNKVLDIIEKIKRCYYGHIHSADKRYLISKYGDTELSLVSSDFINFEPIAVM